LTLAALAFASGNNAGILGDGVRRGAAVATGVTWQNALAVVDWWDLDK
jgi:hypothetical protein